MNLRLSQAVSSNRFYLIAALLFVSAIALYWYTLAPSVTFVDSGELAAVIATDGVSHPSGSPLYLLFGKLVKQIGIGRLILRLNFFSAFCGALSVALTALVFRKFIEIGDLKAKQTAAADKKNRKGKKNKTAKPFVSEQLSFPIVACGSIAASFAWMSNTGLWNTSTIAEVYALHALLISALALLIAAFASMNSNGAQSKQSQMVLISSGFVFGLGLSNYPPFAITAAAVFVLIVRKEGWGFLLQWRRNSLVLAAIAAGLIPYILLPYRAGHDPLLNWGNPSNWENFWKHVSAQQYQIFLGKPKLSVLPKAVELWRNQWPALVWLLQIPGLIWLFLRRRNAFWFSAILGAANLFYILSYDITDVSSAPSDFYVYLLPLSWAGSIWIGAAFVFIVNLIPAIRTKRAAMAFGLIPIAAIPFNWNEASHRNYTYAEDFAASILGEVAPNALILCPDWAFVSPSLYLQHAEMLRNDVIVLDGELLRRSWYFPYLQKRDPEFYELNRATIEIFLRELAKYEEGRPFNPEVITEKYVAMLNGLLSSGLQNGRPPYILLNLEMKDADPVRVAQLEEALGRPPYISSGVKPHLIGYGYNWIPETPAFRLVAGPAGGKLSDVDIPPREFPADRHYDGVTLGVIRRYAEFWRWRGDYYRKIGNCADAIPAYQKSLSLNPELQEAQAGLSACAIR